MTIKAYASAAIIYDNDQFLILKKQGNWVGWQFVQGGIDEGETEEEACLREIQEETGLKDIQIIQNCTGKPIFHACSPTFNLWYLRSLTLNPVDGCPEGVDPSQRRTG